MYVLLALIGSAHGINKNEMSSVELQWEELPGAHEYELELHSLSRKKLKTFKSKNGHFKFRMPVGKYKVRARVADSRLLYSDWSDFSDFVVPVEAPPLSENQITKGMPDPQSLKSKLDLSWGASPQADYYRLEIMDVQGTVLEQHQTDKTHMSVELIAGEYQYRVFGVHKLTGIESLPREKNPKIVISKTQLPPPVWNEKMSETEKSNNLVKWEGHPLAFFAGELEYMPYFGEEWEPVKTLAKTKDKNISFGKKMRPGKYRLKLWAEGEGFESSNAIYREFIIKPEERDLPIVSY